MANQLKMAVANAIITLNQRGWSNRRISRELGIDRETVKRHLVRVFNFKMEQITLHVQGEPGKWTEHKGLFPVSNFRYQFRAIMSKAGIEKREFHDLRRTCLTNWLANGLGEYDVMTMAGHASFETTRRFYLAVRSDLLDRARKASSAALKFISVANLLQTKNERKTKKA